MEQRRASVSGNETSWRGSKRFNSRKRGQRTSLTLPPDATPLALSNYLSRTGHMPSPAATPTGASSSQEYINGVEAQLRAKAEVTAERAQEGLRAVVAAQLGGDGANAGLDVGDDSTVRQVVELVLKLPQLVESHAEGFVRAGAWAECLALLKDDSVGRTRGSKFLLGCAYEALGAGASAGKLLLDAACDGELRAVLSMRRLSTDVDALPGLRLALLDTQMVEGAAETYAAASVDEVIEALRWFEALAEEGNQWARCAVAGILSVGLPGGVLEVNLAAMRQAYETAAEAGLPEAQYALGCWHAVGLRPSQAGPPLDQAHGDGMDRLQAHVAEYLSDHRSIVILSQKSLFEAFEGREVPCGEVAVELLQRAADAGHVAAANWLGECRTKGVLLEADPAAALALFESASESGSARAHINLGFCLREAEGEASRDAALQFLKAAQQGHPQACFLISKCFKMGQGIGQNQKKALEFLKTAASLNHCEALYELGVAHVKGDYVPVDLAEAEHYLDRAIEGGHVAAKYELALNLLPMSDQLDKISKAMKLFHQASAAGHPEAIYQLGVVLEEDGNMAEAAKEYSLAAERGSLDAMFRMGQLCEQQGEHPTLGRTKDRDGAWIEMTFDSAFLWYKRAAAEGHVGAHTKLGSFYDPASKLSWDEKDAKKAFRWYKKAADGGDCIAQYMVGMCYQEGSGVEQNFERAADYYEQGAAQADGVDGTDRHICVRRKSLQRQLSINGQRSVSSEPSPAATIQQESLMMEKRQKLVQMHMHRIWYALGVIYETGCGRPLSYIQAVQFYRKAMNLNGHVRATVALGLCYQSSRGVHMDLMEGVKLFKVAASTDVLGENDEERGYGEPGQLSWAQRCAELEGRKAGVALAQTVLGLCYKHGRGVYRDAAMAIRYFRLGSDGGNGEAACCVGDCYKEGFGVAFNMQQAVRYYRLAAERDHCRGQCIYADYLEEGRGTSKDLVEAAKWYQASASHDWAEGQYKLGRCYMHGIGLEQNSKRAFQWFEKSAAQEFARAEDALGRCYIYGVGTDVNVSKGQELLSLAAQHGFTPAAVRRAPRSFVEACSAFFSRLSRKQAASHPEGESRRGAITDSNGHKSSSFLVSSARSFGLGPSPTVSFAVQHRFNSVTTRDQLTSAAASGPRR